MRWTALLLLLALWPASASAFPMRVEDCPAPLLRGTDGSDRLVVADPSGARVMGFGGSKDVLTGGRGRDCIFGGAGPNEITGGGGDDFLSGAVVEHDSKPSNGRDLIDGGAGADEIMGFGGDDKLIGGAGDDHIDGWGGNDVIEGGPGADAIGGGAGRNVIQGNAGDDRIGASNGERDHVDCGPGRDFVRADRVDVLRGCERIHLEPSRLPRVTPRSGGPDTGYKLIVTPPLDGYVVVQPYDQPCSGVEFTETFAFQRSSTEITLGTGGLCTGRYRLRVTWAPGFPSGGDSRLPWCDRASEVPSDGGDAFYCYGFVASLGQASFRVR
jgi:hypothetical protein